VLNPHGAIDVVVNDCRDARVAGFAAAGVAGVDDDALTYAVVDGEADLVAVERSHAVRLGAVGDRDDRGDRVVELDGQGFGGRPSPGICAACVAAAMSVYRAVYREVDFGHEHHDHQGGRHGS